jgi:hypothetical protein
MELPGFDQFDQTGSSAALSELARHTQRFAGGCKLPLGATMTARARQASEATAMRRPSIKRVGSADLCRPHA